MKPIISIAPKALTIDLDAKDINGKEYVTIELLTKIGMHNQVYVDADRRQLVIIGKKQ